MTIQTLITAIPPPASPTYAFDGPWERIEAELGTPLPQDYKDLVRLYGGGGFMEYFIVNNPASPGPGGELIPEAYEVQKLFVEHHPHLPMYPKPGGLLVCGSSDNGEYLFWLTRGPVSEWPIVVWDHDCAQDKELEVFECDLTDFIAGVVTGDIRPRAFPDDWDLSEDELPFRSWP